MYHVEYSRRVLYELKSLVIRNPSHGAAIINAFSEIDRRFRIYPQFGEPLRDLSAKPAQLWIATVNPLAIHYVLVEFQEERKAGTGLNGQVMILRPFMPFQSTGIR